MKIIKVHDFRKTNASLLFESGASIKDVAQRLGHKSIKTTTDVYVKVTKAKQDETAEQFAKYMAF
ncbi:tyrosine-type recombinase/integrase [Enterococcus saccharolyticus]|uniref:tyrosine-type recombinase/integrase n=1 Tax=Enterococcus saccharolyticus TaxID=41997 RepID=UPI002D804502|nr:tyrosine-type recombinase/integrase [Enterococcus saccharolyticus]MCD5002141.1 tyrosine-type recombinase/integrase [Enterococcus saccharolyticus]